MKKIPQRTCTGCNAKKDKKDLIRIVRTNNDRIIVDKTGKQDGRGAYICNNIQCLEKVRKSKRLERALKTNISNEIFDSLKNLINGGDFIG